MASLQTDGSSTRIILDEAEHRILTQPLDDFAVSYAKCRTARAKEQAGVVRSYAEVRDRALIECCLSFGEALKTLQAKERADFEERFRLTATRRRAVPRGSNTPSQAVYGSAQGIDTIPFDFDYTNQWQQGTVLGDPIAVRSPGPGSIIAASHITQFAQPSAAEATSIAGIGFWYVPTTSGTLTVWLGGLVYPMAQTQFTGIGTSQQNGNASGSAEVYFGIQEFNPAPFQAGAWLSITRLPMVDFDIYGNASYQLGTTGGARGPLYEFVSAPVDDQHYYACWLWVVAYVYTNNLAPADVEIIVWSFNFPYSVT